MAHAKISDQNGRLPDSQLAATSTGHRLRLDAAPALGRVSAAARAAGQDFVGMSDKLPLAGYRTTAEQAELSGTDADAIGAGRSIHSEGLAADLIMSDGYRDARYLGSPPMVASSAGTNPAGRKKAGPGGTSRGTGSTTRRPTCTGTTRRTTCLSAARSSRR